MNDPRSHRARLVLLVAMVIGFCSAELSAQSAPTPVEKPVAVKVLEVDNVSRASFKHQWDSFWKSFWQSFDPTVQLYIINYGSDVQVAKRERWITAEIGLINFDRTRITLVRGGGLGPRSVFWKVPEGADKPKP